MKKSSSWPLIAEISKSIIPPDIEWAKENGQLHYPGLAVTTIKDAAKGQSGISATSVFCPFTCQPGTACGPVKICGCLLYR
jgi:hypothetical protein